MSTDDRFIALRVGVDLVVLHDRLGDSDKAYGLLRKLMGWGAEADMQLRDRLALRKPALARPPDELTARERSIVEFIARGRSNKEIARELGVAPETIKTHMKRIFQKLSAESRAQAVVRAQSLGMLKTNGHHAAL
jgi:DNA-binding NarL/FixJ family response regulator